MRKAKKTIPFLSSFFLKREILERKRKKMLSPSSPSPLKAHISLIKASVAKKVKENAFLSEKRQKEEGRGRFYLFSKISYQNREKPCSLIPFGVRDTKHPSMVYDCWGIVWILREQGREEALSLSLPKNPIFIVAAMQLPFFCKSLLYKIRHPQWSLNHWGCLLFSLEKIERGRRGKFWIVPD